MQVADTPAPTSQTSDLDGWEVTTNVVSTPPPVEEAKTPPAVVAQPPAVDPGDEDDDEADSEAGRDEKGRFRHRAKSDQARAEDVPRIKKLTAKLRETERRLAEVEQRTAPKVETPKPPARPEIRQPESKTFDEPEPTLEQFANSDDPYRDYMRTLAAWDRRKEAFEARQVGEKSRAERASKEHADQMQAWGREREAEYGVRMDAYVKAHPDSVKDFEAVKDRPLTPVMFAALTLSERGPELFHALAKDEELSDEIIALTYRQPLSDELVALVQRKLTRSLSRTQTAQTGTVASGAPVGTAPRPPIPVRTAPMKPSGELPGDESSFAEHESAYHKRRR